MFKGGTFTAEVHVDNHTGKAFGEPKARTITTALVRALSLELPVTVTTQGRSRRAAGTGDRPSKVDGI
jgi:hypothetical protein